MLPSVVAIESTESRQLYDSSIESPPPVIWTDGIFNYTDEIWTDSLGKEITEENVFAILSYLGQQLNQPIAAPTVERCVTGRMWVVTLGLLATLQHRKT